MIEAMACGTPSAPLQRSMHSAQKPADSQSDTDSCVGLILDHFSRCRFKRTGCFAGCGIGSIGDIRGLSLRFPYRAVEALLLISIWHNGKP
jgi:hypothetical protein